MLLHSIRKYYDEKYDLNCAETILYAANEEYSMNLNRQTLKSISAFGGGMGVESVCGAISGSLSVLGIMFVNEKAHESDKIKRLSSEFINRFRFQLEKIDCRDLKCTYNNKATRCLKILETAGTILSEIIERERYAGDNCE